MSAVPAPRPLPRPKEPVRRSPHADVDRVLTLIRARGSGYAIVSPRRRPPARRRPAGDRSGAHPTGDRVAMPAGRRPPVAHP